MLAVGAMPRPDSMAVLGRVVMSDCLPEQSPVLSRMWA